MERSGRTGRMTCTYHSSNSPRETGGCKQRTSLDVSILRVRVLDQSIGDQETYSGFPVEVCVQYRRRYDEGTISIICRGRCDYLMGVGRPTDRRLDNSLPLGCCGFAFNIKRSYGAYFNIQGGRNSSLDWLIDINESLTVHDEGGSDKKQRNPSFQPPLNTYNQRIVV